MSVPVANLNHTVRGKQLRLQPVDGHRGLRGRDVHRFHADRRPLLRERLEKARDSPMAGEVGQGWLIAGKRAAERRRGQHHRAAGFHCMFEIRPERLNQEEECR